MRGDNVSRTRRHFFHVVNALAGGAVLTTVSKPAKAAHPSPSSRCILRGTRILTSRGTERIECLSIGDSVVTTRGEKPVKWIGRQHFSQDHCAQWPDSIHPIRVSRSALANNVPHADLYLSPWHALLIDDVLIRVKDLVNGTSIIRAAPEGMTDTEYFNIELETHEVILAEGAPIATMLPTEEGREAFSNFVEYERLYGPDEKLAMVSYAPILDYSGGRAHLKALLRLGVSQVVDVRDPMQVAYDRIAARASRVPV